jgi:hypothetical protein
MWIELSGDQINLISTMLDEAIEQMNLFPEVLESDPGAIMALHLIENCNQAIKRQTT